MQGTDQLLNLTSMHDLLMCNQASNSKLAKHVMNSAIVHIIWGIWLERNHRRFSNKQCHMSSIFNNILVEVKLSFDLVLTKGSSALQDFKVARLFGIPLKARRFVPLLDVTWIPPHLGCIKFNCDGSAFGSPSCGAIGVVLRAFPSIYISSFVQNIGYETSLEAEFCACLFALERASEMHYGDIWIETDSLSVVKAYNTGAGVPSRMQARWLNCIHFCSQIRCKFTHVFREGNMVADAFGQKRSKPCFVFLPKMGFPS